MYNISRTNTIAVRTTEKRTIWDILQLASVPSTSCISLLFFCLRLKQHYSVILIIIPSFLLIPVNVCYLLIPRSHADEQRQLHISSRVHWHCQEEKRMIMTLQSSSKTLMHHTERPLSSRVAFPECFVVLCWHAHPSTWHQESYGGDCRVYHLCDHTRCVDERCGSNTSTNERAYYQANQAIIRMNHHSRKESYFAAKRTWRRELSNK